MDKLFDYSKLLNEAYSQIKSIRDPKNGWFDEVELDYQEAKDDKIFEFGSPDFYKQKQCTEAANSISEHFLNGIICNLLSYYGYKYKLYTPEETEKFGPPVRLVIFDQINDCLLIFKGIEECAVFKSPTDEPSNIKQEMKKLNTSSVKYIYYIKNKAHKQFVGYNEAIPGARFNVYSLDWFMISYFGASEWESFLRHIKEYQKEVNQYLGYITVKTLTPNALTSFKSNYRITIETRDYFSLCSEIKANKHQAYLLKSEFELIHNNFFKNEIYYSLCSNSTFAESFITAEWLYETMNQSQAVDLTMIGFGYFKAIEQLLDYIIYINRTTLNKPKYNPTELTLGDMTHYIKNNYNIFSDRFSSGTKNYIKEVLFDYAKLRNCCFHKENIHDFKLIEKIRDKSFQVSFLLIGSVNEDIRKMLINLIPDYIHDDFYKLCEYIHYHADETFELEIPKVKVKNGPSGSYRGIVISERDSDRVLSEDGEWKYSGITFRTLGKDNQFTFHFTDPFGYNIYKISLHMSLEDKITFSPSRTETVFKDGIFLSKPFNSIKILF